MFLFLWEGRGAIVALAIGIGVVPFVLGLLKSPVRSGLLPCVLAFAFALSVAELVHGPAFYYDFSWWG
jgi:hypothetical protein